MAITKVSASLVDLDGGVVINESSADADFRVESNGNANMLFVDGGNDRVGIGTASPARKVQIQDTSSTVYLSLVGPTNAGAGIMFGDSDDETVGRVTYDNSVNNMQFWTNDSEKMRIQSDGDFFLNTTSAMANCFVSFQDGNNGEAMFGISAKNDSNVGIRLGVGTDRKWVMYRNTSDDLIFYNNASSGERVRFLDAGGIAFNGDTAAANALDDYEEGTWTATLSSSGGSFAASSTSFTGGTYTKIGNTVTAQIYSSAFNITNAGSGYAKISGLPFTSVSSSTSYGGVIFYHTTCFANPSPTGYVAQNADFTISSIGDQSTTNAQAWKVANSVYFMVQVQYTTA